MYHIAHATALAEYLITLYLKPESKNFVYVSQLGDLKRQLCFPEGCAESMIGIIVVLCGQALRSLAMIHASTNFSHAVAFEKRNDHQLVTDGIYAFVFFLPCLSIDY